MTPEEVVRPMFPLGTVLLPHALLPLHVFEARYRALVRDCLGGDATFGVVLIARGSEVGGRDERTSRGTLARIVEAAELPDGRWVLGTLGTERVDVVRWLPDAPYPRATVRVREDVPAAADVRPALARVTTLARRCAAALVELGAASAVPDELDDDPSVASFQAAAVAQLGPADAYDLLAIDAVDERLDAVEELLAGHLEVLTFRLGAGDEPG